LAVLKYNACKNVLANDDAIKRCQKRQLIYWSTSPAHCYYSIDSVMCRVDKTGSQVQTE